MDSMNKSKENLCATARYIQNAVQASFDIGHQDEDIEGYVERRDFFFSMVKATVRCSDVAFKSLEAWKNAIIRRQKECDRDSESYLKETFSALASLTGFLLERSDPTRADGGFALRPHLRRMLNESNRRANRILETWMTPSPRTPVVHETVVLSPEGVQAWEEAMNPESSQGKPKGFKPRRLAEGATDS